jgi:hypothetical protein
MQIKFYPAFKDADLFYEKPTPAVSAIPDWYKKIPLTFDGDKPRIVGDLATNMTAKACSPFLDSLSAGYMFFLPADIQIDKNEDGGLSINWLVDIPDFISSHSAGQTDGISFSDNTPVSALKWRAGWRVSTPKGYSTLFIHPLNRTDLPFYTLSGIVDTDTYRMPTEFPFVFDPRLIEDSLIIPKGTPIVQAIPFKRNDWYMGFGEFDKKEYKRERFKLRSKISRSYKSMFWQRKVFK